MTRKRDEPVPLRDALAALGRDLGVPDPDVLARVVTLWREVVGSVVAAHAHVRSVRDGVCTVDGRRPGVGDAVAVPRTGRRRARVERALRAGCRGVGEGRRVPGPRRARLSRSGLVALRGPKHRPLTRTFAFGIGVRAARSRQGSLHPADHSRSKERTRGVRGQGHLDSQGPPAGPRAARHVHRFDRSVGPAPPRVRGRRQRGRRGVGGLRDAHRRHAARRRRLPRGRQRPRNPGRPAPRIPRQVARPRSCSRCCTPAASSAARATRSPAVCTASASRS